MKTTQMELDKGFYAVFFGTTVLYYSYGKLIGVQTRELVYVSENYWLGETMRHVALLRTNHAKVPTYEVALDVLEERMVEEMRRTFG